MLSVLLSNIIYHAFQHICAMSRALRFFAESFVMLACKKLMTENLTSMLCGIAGGIRGDLRAFGLFSRSCFTARFTGTFPQLNSSNFSRLSSYFVFAKAREGLRTRLAPAVLTKLLSARFAKGARLSLKLRLRLALRAASLN